MSGIDTTNKKTGSGVGTESDEAVIQRVVGGDVDAFEILVCRHRQRVFEIVGRRIPSSDVETVAEEVFVSAFQSLATFEGHQPFEHWLLRIARRRCCDYWRERERRRALVETDAGLGDEQCDWLERVGAVLSAEMFGRECEQRGAVETVRWALGQLSAEDRTLMESIYFEDVPLREVAATFGWSLPNVKIRAMRARHRLRRLLGRLEERK